MLYNRRLLTTKRAQPLTAQHNYKQRKHKEKAQLTLGGIAQLAPLHLFTFRVEKNLRFVYNRLTCSALFTPTDSIHAQRAPPSRPACHSHHPCCSSIGTSDAPQTPPRSAAPTSTTKPSPTSAERSPRQRHPRPHH